VPVGVIAIDTSARRRITVVRTTPSGALLAARVAEAAPSVLSLHAALRELHRGDDGAVVVVTGPGSYTGLRAGMAAGLGLAHAAGLPLFGLSSLEVAAHSAPGEPAELLALVDAGRGGVYAARFVRGEDGLSAVEPARRLSLAPEDPSPLATGLPLAILDRVGLPGLEPGDPALALSRSVPVALSRPPLSPAGLTGTYLE
jgi:tRNA threonylcarbamoyl adenosine modification protein YeaZ